jgi:hypothetical protein
MLTSQLRTQLSQGTLDAPTWGLIRTAKAAARIYAPLGTQMSLGDYVRVVRTFQDAFVLASPPRESCDGQPKNAETVISGSASAGESTDDAGVDDEDAAQRAREDAQVRALQTDLSVRYSLVILSWSY